MADAVLTAEAVGALMTRCSTPDGALTVQGVVNTYRFDPARVAEATPEIAALLAELPDTFRLGSGAGWSFLNVCTDRHDRLWTGLQVVMEQLVCLGIAAGKARWSMDRDYWPALPGGMPYVTVLVP